MAKPEENIPISKWNNNPGNIRPGKLRYEGLIGIDDRGFGIFKDYESGRAALDQDIQAKLKNGLITPQKFIDRYLGDPERDTENTKAERENYKKHLAKSAGLKSIDDPWPEDAAKAIADAIEGWESGEANKRPSKATEPASAASAAAPRFDEERAANVTISGKVNEPVQEDVDGYTGSNTEKPGRTISGAPASDQDVSGDLLAAAAGVPAAYIANKARQSVTIPASILRQKDALTRGSKEISGLRSVSDQMAAKLAEIQAKHDYLHGSQAIDDRLPPNLRPQPPAPPPFVVERVPEGGPAVVKYAKEFGANELQAQNAKSMQEVQRKLILENQANRGKAQEISSRHAVTNVSPLALTPEQVNERLKQTQAAQSTASPEVQQKESLLKAEREKIQSQLEKPRAVIAADLARASGDAADAQNALRARTAPQLAISTDLARDVSKLPTPMQARVANYSGDAGFLSRAASGVGRALNKVAVPLTILQTPLSAKQAYQDFQKGNYYDAAKSGAAAAGGALQGAALGAAMLASGPAVVGGLAATGGALGLASLAAELPDALAYIKRESPAAYQGALSYLQKNGYINK
jgi:hypothetical protein